MCSSQTSSAKLLLIKILFCLALSLGFWVSWLTVEVHLDAAFGQVSDSSICSSSQEFDCQAVAKSNWSTIYGIPLGIYGMAFYASLLGLLIQNIFFGNLSWVAIFQLFSLPISLSAIASIVLLFVSFFLIKALCPLCLILHFVNFSLLILLAYFLFVTTKSQGFFAGIRAEYRIFFVQAARDICGGNLKKILSFYLLGLLIVALVLLGAMTAYRYQEVQSASKVTDWPKNQKLKIPLNLSASQNGDYYFGNLSSAIEIVEFADYECPYCRMLGSNLKLWLKDYEDKYYFVYLNYPLDQSCNRFLPRPMHQHACDLAELNRCAGEQGKFWDVYFYLMRMDYEDFLYSREDLLNTLTLKLRTFADLDSTLLEECLGSDRQLEALRNNVEIGKSLGLTGTPALFINGQQVRNIGEQTVRNIMEKVTKP